MPDRFLKLCSVIATTAKGDLRQLIVRDYNSYTSKICDSCECDSRLEERCTGTCTWADTEARCTYDWRAGVTYADAGALSEDMLQCDSTGACLPCVEIYDETACGYLTYPQWQMRNCTWTVPANVCLPSDVERERRMNAFAAFPKQDFDAHVKEFFNACASLGVAECKLRSGCVWLEGAYGLEHTSTCTVDPQSPDYDAFWTGMKYSNVAIAKLRECALIKWQSACINAGCEWIDMTCASSAKNLCQLQCNISTTGHLRHAYFQELRIQCGDPCEASLSDLAIGEGDRLFDTTDRLHAEEVCGAKCAEDSRCEGFNFIDSMSRCMYRKSTTCYKRVNPDRDCYSKKAQCNTLTCPKGYIGLESEQYSYCKGRKCTVIDDRDSCCGKALCFDVQDWYSGPGCEAEGFGTVQGCNPQGWTCGAYELWRWCEPTIIARGRPVRGVEWSLGEANNFPEKNCCICDGGLEVLPGVVIKKMTNLPELTRNPPKEHICCVAYAEGFEGVRAFVPSKINETGLDDILCSTVLQVPAPAQSWAACSYCNCIYEDGHDLLTDPVCCSARRFGIAGVDPESGLHYCANYNPVYSETNERMRSCELRYDLYSGCLPRLCSCLVVLVLAMLGGV